MSISTLDSPVLPSSTLDTSPLSPQANRSAPSTPFSGGQNQANVNYQSRENASGPVFGDHQPPANRGGDHPHRHQNQNPLAMGNTMHYPSFRQLFKQWLSQWFGGCRPPAHPPCNSAPPRPHPTIGCPQPRPNYALQSDKQLAQALLDNFEAFSGACHGKFITLNDIRAMSERRPIDDNVRLAKEMLKRPDLLKKMNSNGDEHLSRREVERATR